MTSVRARSEVRSQAQRCSAAKSGTPSSQQSADEWRSGPVGTVRAGHHDRCLGRSQQGSDEGASWVRATRKAAQSRSDQGDSGTPVTTTAALGAANKAVTKALPAPGASGSAVSCICNAAHWG
jgi:hypothetical protein